jgi:hypothetical protein
MGLMVALAPAAIFFGLMIWKDRAGEKHPEVEARVRQRMMSPHQA